MCDVPLDVQRRFEQRWAARFARPVPPKKQDLKGEDLPATTAAKSKEKTRRAEPAGLRSAPVV
jgi:hypothetical protein